MEHIEKATQIRSRAASLALGAIIIITALKLWAAWLSGSVGVLSEGVHSLLDLVSAMVAFFTVKAAVKPPDEDHPFGHGKFETLSSLLESMLLLAAAGFIFYEAIQRSVNPQPIDHSFIAIAVMAFSLIVSYGVFIHNNRAAKQVDSSALAVNALHFLADVLTAVAVIIGLIIIELTGWLAVDAIVAFIVAVYISFLTWKQLKKSISELVDIQLPDNEIELIKNSIKNFDDRVINLHNLRTRKSGPVRHVDFHMMVCQTITVKDSHALCDQVENKIRSLFGGQCSIQAHVEPCDQHGNTCKTNCPYSPQNRN